MYDIKCALPCFCKFMSMNFECRYMKTLYMYNDINYCYINMKQDIFFDINYFRFVPKVIFISVRDEIAQKIPNLHHFHHETSILLVRRVTFINSLDSNASIHRSRYFCLITPSHVFQSIYD